MLNRLQQFTCPCCKGYIGEAPNLDDVDRALGSGTMKNLFRVLKSEPGKPFSTDKLRDAIYAGRWDGGPENATTVTKQAVGRLRKVLEPYGWTIASSGNRGPITAVYRLIPLEAGAC